MSTPYTVPSNCKISADFNLLCHFRQINLKSSFKFRTGVMKRIRGLAEAKRRFTDGKRRAKYTGTRIGKRAGTNVIRSYI